MDMTIFETGINAFREYMNNGSQMAVGLMSELALMYFIYVKKDTSIPTAIRYITKLAGVIFVVLLLPGTSDLLYAIGMTQSAAYMFGMLPVVIITGACAVVLWEKMSAKSAIRKAAAGASFAIMIFILGLLVPWRLTSDNIHMISNSLKISEDAIAANRLLSGHTALLPQRLYAQIGEFESSIMTWDGVGTSLAETPDAMGQFGLDNNFDFIGIDTKVLAASVTENLDTTMATYYYEPYETLGRYAYYWKGVTWTFTQYADERGTPIAFYTLTDDVDGTLIAIDGGSGEYSDTVRQVITEKGSAVSVWILTDETDEHAGAFYGIYDEPGDIVIQKVYSPSNSSFTNPMDGEVVYVGDISLTFFDTSDEGMTFMAKARRNRLIFMTQAPGAEKLDEIYDAYSDAFNADYTQIADYGGGLSDWCADRGLAYTDISLMLSGVVIR